MSTYSYPVFNQDKRKRKRSENSISFKELLDKELRKQQEQHEEVAQSQSVTVKPMLRYDMIDLLNLEKKAFLHLCAILLMLKDQDLHHLKVLWQKPLIPYFLNTEIHVSLWQPLPPMLTGCSRLLTQLRNTTEK